MMDLIPDIISELLFMLSDCHSLQGPFDWVDNSRRIRRYFTRVCSLAAFSIS